jgi:hypothetical protein
VFSFDYTVQFVFFFIRILSQATSAATTLHHKSPFVVLCLTKLIFFVGLMNLLTDVLSTFPLMYLVRLWSNAYLVTDAVSSVSASIIMQQSNAIVVT